MERASPGGGAGGSEGAGVEEPVSPIVVHRQQGEVWAAGRAPGADGGENQPAGVVGDEAADLGTQPPPNLPPNLPSMDELNSTLVPTLKWCPKAARGEFARELASLWNRLNENPEDVKLWNLEFMFARCILPAGRGPRAGDAYSMARLVRERLRRWRAGEYPVLWQEAVNLT